MSVTQLSIASNLAKQTRPRGRLELGAGKHNKRANEFDAIVAQRLRAARLAANLSMEDLGAVLGLTFQQVQKYENGTNRLAAGKLPIVAKACGVPISYFFADSESLVAKAAVDIGAKFLGAPYGAELARAFLAIRNAKERHAVLVIAKAFAERSGSRG